MELEEIVKLEELETLEEHEILEELGVPGKPFPETPEKTAKQEKAVPPAVVDILVEDEPPAQEENSIEKDRRAEHENESHLRDPSWERVDSVSA